MILDEIKFRNYGVYRGTQTVTLTPPTPEKPIILLGGLNGGGKTTLLDGLQLALYGKNAHCSNRGELAYDEFLRRSIHRGVDPHEGAGVEITFRHTTEGKEHTYRVNRSWAENGKFREKIEVQRDGAFDPVLSDHWAEHVESFIPLGISDLFFFDGEKIEQLADINNASRVLSTAIHSLLGIELVDRLGADLMVLERRKRVIVRSDAAKKLIDEYEADLARIQELHELTLLERGSAQNEFEQAEKTFRRLQERFRLEGGELFAKRDQLTQQHKAIEVRLRQAEQELRELAAGPVPLTIVRELLSRVERQAEREHHRQESKLLERLLKERDQDLLRTLKKAGGTTSIIGAAERFFHRDRASRLESGASEYYLGLDPRTRQDLRAIRRTLLPEVQRKTRQLIAQVEEFKEEQLRLDHQLAAVPDADALEALQKQLSQAEHDVYRLKARVETLDAKLVQLKNEKDRKHASLVALIEGDIDDQVKHADDLRILHHSEKVRTTLKEFRVAVVQTHVSRIQQLMLESFQQLLRKASLISEIRISPDNFALELRGGDGRLVQPDRLSAGERQLLAVSMLWGLARASGRPLPTIIDTPLGRLDSSHRTHLVERYFPFASHQVILLSTDEEIDGEFLTKLRPRIGRTYRLTFRDKTNSTEIEPGYFWNQ